MRRLRGPLLVAVAFLAGVGSTTLAQSSTVTLRPGESVLVVAEDVATTTSTMAPTTTTTTTVAPTTTRASTTTAPPVTAGFVETFDGNTGLDRFDFGVYHRDDFLVAQRSWSADHDLDCGLPNTQRTVRRDTDEWFYACRDHMRTAIGDTSGYSTAYFSPKQTFATERVVSWDVTVTDLLARQWWEVSIVPASFRSGVASCPQCSVVSWLSPDPAGLPAYPAESIVVGKGPFGNDVNIYANGASMYTGWQKACGQAWDLFESSGACDSKTQRLTFSITENTNGTITVDYGGQHSQTFAGRFPAEYSVVFKDHNYTPDKDGRPVGHTWHWDNIVVR